MLPLLPVDEALSADDARLLPIFADPPRPWAKFDLTVGFAGLPFGDIRRHPLDAVACGVHVADWLVEAFDPKFSDRSPHLDVRVAQGAELAVHPGAGSPAKRWPPRQLAAVVQAMALPSALVCGPADEGAVEALSSQIPGPTQVWRGLTLPELARRLKGSHFFLGNDSGISHLAAAVGTPTAGIYVSTDPAIWGIRGPRVVQLPADVAPAAVAVALGDLA